MNWLKKTSVSAILSAMVLCFASCGDEDTKDTGTQPTVTGTTPGTIANILANDPRFKVLATALDISGKLSQLDDTTQKFTIFAPVDAAFNALPNSFMTTTNFVSTGDRSKLTINISDAGLGTLLLAHVVTDNAAYADVASITSPLTSAANSTISVSLVDPTPADATPSTLHDDFPIINGRAQVIEENVPANNGRIHVIDTVLIPTTQLAQANEIDADAFPGTLFNLFEATPLFRPFLQLLRDGENNAVIAAFDDPDSEYTVFVPAANIDKISSVSDAAFLHLVKGTVKAADLGSEVENIRYAKLPVTQDQGNTLIEGTKVVATDLEATNGVIHVTEGVIPFPASSPADVITTRGELTSFASILKDTDAGSGTMWLDTLRTDQTRTIFAPSNSALAAFSALVVDLGDDGDEASDVVTELKAVDQYNNLLLYHTTLAGNAQSLDAPTTVLTALDDDASQALTIESSTLGAYRVLNGVIEVQETVAVGNSYVHIIGNVLVPDNADKMDLTPPEIKFPGTTADALSYFTLFSGYAALADASPVGIKLQAADTGAFTGTLLDVFALDTNNTALLVPAEEKVYDGQLIDPYAIDTDGNGTLDTNFAINFDDDNDPNTPDASTTTTTVFVPVNSALPDDVNQYLFELDNDEYLATDIAPYHAVPKTLKAADLTTGTFASLAVDQAGAVGKFDIDVDTTSGVVLNGQATVKYPDLETDNGVIHVIDTVINP